MTWLTDMKKQGASLLAVFAIALLCAQVSSLTHSIDHHQHGDQELCNTFVSFESSSIDVTVISVIPEVYNAAIVSVSYQWNELPQTLTRHGLTRAPPLFTV